MWTPQLILGGLLFVADVALTLFGITLVVVVGYYFLRDARSTLRGHSAAALHQKVAVAMPAGNLGLMAVVCGPLVGCFIGLMTLPAVMIEPGFGFFQLVLVLLLSMGLRALAGIIAGGAFWASSAVLGRVRKTVKKWSRRGVWDPDLDGLA